MTRAKTELNNYPDTLQENKRILREIQSENKVEHKSLYNIKKIIGKFNAKNNASILSRNNKGTFASSQETSVDVVYGPIENFPSGSWWGIRMDCSRDGVHKPFDESIETGSFGVTSLCTSQSNLSNDVDFGDYLTYTADECISTVQDRHPLFKNYKNELPLRLIRSYNLCNEYAPRTGYRYDGLYLVVACWIGVVSETEKHYKFAFARLPNQDPVPWQKKKETVPKSHLDAESNNMNNERSRLLLASANNCCTSKRKNICLDEEEKMSDIVTRCTSQKKLEEGQCNRVISVALQDDSNYHSLLKNPSSVCKLQNTNISIRTNLYDSSISKQESRKSTPMTFCRTYKSSRLSGRVATNHSSNVMSLNLNSCGPCPRETEQESLIQSRSNIVKIPSTSSDQSKPTNNSNGNNINNNNINSYDNIDNGDAAGVENSIIRRDAAVGACIDKNNMIQQENLEKRIIEDNEKIQNDEVPKNVQRHFFSNNESKEQDRILKESCINVESFSPDQMLNFIIKQKYNPTAKLLIGKVIGLATGEESTILRAYESLITRNNGWSNEKSTKNDEKMYLRRKDIFSVRDLTKEVDSKKECKKKNEQVLRKNLPNTRVSRESNNKDNSMRKTRIPQTRVSKRLMGIEKKKKSLTMSASTAQSFFEETKSTIATISHQTFSKASLSKQGTKKRRGELANLVIDANFGSFIRGPRNRRLRYGGHIFAKKTNEKNSNIISSCYSRNSNNNNNNMSRRKKKINRGTLSARKLKEASWRESVYESLKVKRKLGEGEMKNKRDSKRRSESLESNEIAEDEEEILKNNERWKKREKLSSSSGDRATVVPTVSSNTISWSEVESRKDSEISKRKMVDAATQHSSFKKDAATSVDNEILQRDGSNSYVNSVKIEWIDVDDFKSENRYSEIRRSSNDGGQFQPQMEDYPSEATEASSAFVPVNPTDGNFRIARLRSIGFRPIQPHGTCYNEDKNVNDEYEENNPSTSTDYLSERMPVVTREVDQLFKKYTSNESPSVGYIDQQLCFQDIEQEEKVYYLQKEKYTRGRGVKNILGDNKICSEEDSEVPWHGWKKFVNNKQSQWLGW